MAEELDSFVSKFKSLWTSGQQARLTINSRNGRVWVNLQVGLRCPQPHHDDGVPKHQGHGLGNSKQRRQIRRAAARAAKATEVVAEKATTVDEAIENIANPSVDGASVKKVSTKEEDPKHVEVHKASSESKYKECDDIGAHDVRDNKVSSSPIPQIDGQHDSLEKVHEITEENENKVKSKSQYPRRCEDCDKFLRDNNDFRKHVVACVMSRK